jgi:predicted component of type VI protein secretion system
MGKTAADLFFNQEMKELAMNLILEVVARDGQPTDCEPRKVFGLEGGHIGRAPDCEWVLPSPFISRHHATVCCVDDVFYIVGTGKNGVALNDVVLPNFEHRALNSGDRLFIDDYEVAVAISEVAAPAPSGPPPVLLLAAEAAQTVPPSPPPQISTTSTSNGLRVPPAGTTALEDDTGSCPTGDSYDMFDLSTVLLGAGIEPDSLSPETAQMLGSLLPPLVQGLIEALRTRADLRRRLRLPVTGIQISPDDPLKFEIDVEDARLAETCQPLGDSERET